MTAANDLLQRTAERLARDYAVDAGLDKVSLDMQGEAARESVETAGKLLRERAKALKSAVAEVENLRLQIAELAEALPFTEQGWQQRRKELEEGFATDFHHGLAAWLQDWAKAAAGGQLDALDRLVTQIEIGHEGKALQERCALATAGLRNLEWELSQPALHAAALGIGIGESTVPDEQTRGGLWMLLARLALQAGRLEDAAAMLEAGAELAPEATVNALRARLARQRGETDSEQRWLEAGRGADPTNLDVVIGSIEQARSEEREDFALEMARLTVDAMPNVAHGERELRPLLGEVPGAIWLAVAERATREHDLERCEWASEEAAGSAASESVLAMAAELRAEAMAARQAPAPERAAVLLEAGSHWFWAGEPDHSVTALETAHKLNPEDGYTTLFLASALTESAESEPLALGREKIARALDLVVRGRELVLSAESKAWSYRIAASNHLMLAQAITPPTSPGEHQWRALDTSLRGLVHRRNDAFEWQHFFGIVNPLDLATFAEQVARQSLALEREDEDDLAKTQLAMSLANVGRFDEVLELMPVEDRATTQSLRAFVAIRRDDPKGALALLRELEQIPDWLWVRYLLLAALVISGRDDEIREAAEALIAQCKPRDDELDYRSMAGNAAIALGDFDLAEDLLQPVVAAESDFATLIALGQLRLLRGERERGTASLLEAVEQGGYNDLGDWDTFFSPMTGALASRFSVEIGPLDEIDEAVARRRAAVAPADPVAELERLIAPASFPATTVAVTRSLGIALARLIQAEPEEALKVLEPALAEAPEDVELQLLLEQAKEALSLQRAEPAGAATGAEPADEGYAIRVELPPSWFEAHDNPVLSHPIFLRYIPEMRVRAGWMVPGVQITIDKQLEPDAYRIFIFDRPVAEGAVDLESAYLWDEAAKGLGLTGTPPGDDIEAGLPGLVAIPHAALAGPGGLAELLAIDAEELIVRRVGALIEGHAEELGKP